MLYHPSPPLATPCLPLLSFRLAPVLLMDQSVTHQYYRTQHLHEEHQGCVFEQLQEQQQVADAVVQWSVCWLAATRVHQWWPPPKIAAAAGVDALLMRAGRKVETPWQPTTQSRVSLRASRLRRQLAWGECCHSCQPSRKHGRHDWQPSMQILHGSL